MQNYPYDIIITIDDDIIYEKSKSYKEWVKEYKLIKIPSFDLSATTGAGTLFPPNILKINYTLIYDIYNCITADDLFLKYIENKLNIKIVWVENTKLMGLKLLYNNGMYLNENKKGNDKCRGKFIIKKKSKKR